MPLIVGCAQIKSFSVAPSTACPGEAIKIDWQVSGNSGSVILDAIPPLKGTGEVAAEGSRSLTLMHSNRFVLKAPGLLKSEQREWDVLVIPSQSSRLFGGVAHCGGNPQSVLTSFTIQQKDTSSRVRAVSIANNYHRPLSVSKEGVESKFRQTARSIVSKIRPLSESGQSGCRSPWMKSVRAYLRLLRVG